MTRRTPSVSACSSLYQSRIWPGVHPASTVAVNERRTSLSLKAMFVRGSELTNGYGTVHWLIAAHPLARTQMDLLHELMPPVVRCVTWRVNVQDPCKVEGTCTVRALLGPSLVAA